MTNQLGNLVKGEQGRDAVHVAIVPMKAAEMLRPGQRVGLIGESEAGPSESCIGIVDPYLTDVVPKGERFWLCLLPETVTGMRHHWEHPAFSDSEAGQSNELRQYAESWLRDQCGELGCTFEELTDTTGDLLSGEYVRTSMNESARDHWYEIQDEFWKQIETYLGKQIEESNRGGFTCSC